MVKDIENVKIHFAYIDHVIERKFNLRKRLLNATEDERIEIIKHSSLHNSFLIKRRNITFSNLFYFKILTNRNAQNEILPKLYKILTERFLPKKKLEELTSSDAVRAHPSLNIESYLDIMKKLNLTTIDSIRYLKSKEKFYHEKGDTDMAMATRSLLKEFSPPGLFTLNDLFTDQLLAKFSIHPLRYDKFYNRYVLQEVHNFSLYNLPRDPNIYFHSMELNDRIAESLVKKLINFVHDNLGLQPDFRIILQYAPLFNHLLSIASSIFFENLPLEEKLHLVNKNFTVHGLIEYRPDILQPISATVRISNKFLSSYSEVHYNDWINQYNGIFNAANTYPLYLFHDVDGLPQLIVDSLRIYLNINSRIIKLQE